VCGIDCDPNYHRCPNTVAGTCVSVLSTSSCGASCNPCPAPPAHGIATCDGNPLACGVECETPGFHLCGTAAAPTCLDNSDVNSCGASCTPCPVAGSACVGGLCVPPDGGTG
jgi:hypothetical protein